MSTRPEPTQEEFFGPEEPCSYADLKAGRASVTHFSLPRIVIPAERRIDDEVGDFVAAVKAEVRSYYARRCARHALVAFLAGAATGAVAALAAVMAVARG